MKIFEVAPNRFLIRLHHQEELMQSMRDFAEEHKIGCGVVRGLGAASSAELAFYDLEEKKYENHTFEEETEIAGLIGNFTRGPEGEPLVHIHTALGRRDCSSLTGHVNWLRAGATVELDVEVFPGTLRRAFDEKIGLNLQDCFFKS